VNGGLTYLRALRRWTWMIVLFGIIAGVTAYAVTRQQPRFYSTDTVALVNPTVSVVLPGSATATSGFGSGDQLVDTYVSLLNTSPVRDRLIQDGIPRDSGTLAGELVPIHRVNTNLIQVNVTDSDPQVALSIAQDIIPAFNRSLTQLESRVPGSPTRAQLEALVPWEVPTAAPGAAVSTNAHLAVLVAAAAGVLVGVGIALLLEFLDDTIKTEADVRTRLHTSVLGTVIFQRGKGRKKKNSPELVTLSNPQDPTSESYRAMRTSLLFASTDTPLRTLVVTSTAPSEGKTTTAANLAVVMAQAGHTVILVDADFRRPDIHRVFRRRSNHGLGNLILRDRPEEELILPTEVPNLSIVCSGPIPPNPSELLGSKEMERVVERLQQRAELGIFDTPPLGAVTDATLLAAASDGVLLVVERGKTTAGAIERSLATLESVHARLLGVILNKARGLGSAGYYYYYGPTETKPEHKQKRGAERAAAERFPVTAGQLGKGAAVPARVERPVVPVDANGTPPLRFSNGVAVPASAQPTQHVPRPATATPLSSPPSPPGKADR